MNQITSNIKLYIKKSLTNFENANYGMKKKLDLTNSENANWGMTNKLWNVM